MQNLEYFVNSWLLNKAFYQRKQLIHYIWLLISFHIQTYSKPLQTFFATSDRKASTYTCIVNVSWNFLALCC